MKSHSEYSPITVGPSEILDFQKKILDWYKEKGRKLPWRKKSTSIYQRIISEVLLQRTKAETVASFFPAFVKSFPSWKSLATATESQIGSYLKPIGLWRRRAESLSRLSQEMVRRNGRFPRDRNEIESLPGVGQYIANAIELFCHGKPMPLLDANMARVLERCFGPRKLADIRYDRYLQELSRMIVSCHSPQEINWAVLDLASLVCKASTMHHDICPLKQCCKFFRTRVNR